MTLSILENIPLRNLTTFKVGGAAHYFCEVTTEGQLVEALAFAKEKSIPFFILGGGSNILVADKGFSGLVIKMMIQGITNVDDTQEGVVKITVGAGENWDRFVDYSVERGFYGLENLSKIPGTVGAAPVQNIGAYGVEVKDVIESVRVFDVQKNIFVSFSSTDCQFEYRDSLFKKHTGQYVVVSVTFTLHTKGTLNIQYKDVHDFFLHIIPNTPRDVRSAVIVIRSRKLPDVAAINALGTAGSFFKNPIISLTQFDELKKKYPELPSYPATNASVKIPLAWILDHVCGYRGATKGNVGTYQNQALVLMNNGDATAQEIKDFAQELIVEVKNKTGISVEPEVQYVG